MVQSRDRIKLKIQKQNSILNNKKRNTIRKRKSEHRNNSTQHCNFKNGTIYQLKKTKGENVIYNLLKRYVKIERN